MVNYPFWSGQKPKGIEEKSIVWCLGPTNSAGSDIWGLLEPLTHAPPHRTFAKPRNMA